MTLRARIFRNAMTEVTHNGRRAEQIERSHKPITISVEDALASCEENLNNLDAETITGSNERKGSEMPAERNGDHKYCLPVERHACIQSISKGE